MDLSDRREHYEAEGLDIGDVDADPIRQFEHWYRDAEEAELWEPNACVVSAVDAEGWPTSRFVLLKGFGPDGFSFFTNYQSDKGRALEHSGRAALTFGWLPLRRQVRIQGPVERVSELESDRYFAQRPPGSQLGAWASPQSEVVADRAELDRRFAAIEAGIGEGLVERPPHWGGYRVTPVSIEFWQGRPNRFHDRLRYRRDGNAWVIERLAP